MNSSNRDTARHPGLTKKISIQHILTANQSWWNFYEKYNHKIRPAILIGITKLLSCKNKFRGYHEYRCSNPACPHLKRIYHTCKSKTCSSCGKKSTEHWIQKQNALLPKTSWQHITFTMPSQLWDFFWCNRHLLNTVSALAARCVMDIASRQGVNIGIFTALHTFSRSLKRNVHLHLSTTAGGLVQDTLQWKNVYFNQNALMRMWRYRIVQLFRKEAKKGLIIPPSILKQLNPAFTFDPFLDHLYRKTWIVHCSKTTHDHQQTVSYLGRYVKRPPIAESRLKHYNGHSISFNYLDRTTKTYRRLTLSVEQFIARFIQHIPDLNFRMVRYYGFLANRVRGKLLPQVYQALRHHPDNANTLSPTYAELIQKNFGFDPLTCVLCAQPLILAGVHFGKPIHELLQHHRQLALLKNF